MAADTAGGSARARVVYAAAAVQGIVLVTAPAASNVFTSPTGYGLSSAQYGALFLPQVITAISAAVFGARASRRFGRKRVYLAGLAGGVVAMALLASSQLLVSSQPAAYTVLLVATAFLGAGFGLTVPALNSLAAAFHPRGPDRAVLVLNALLGLGTALAPVFVAVFVGLGFWWGLPIVSGLLLVGLIVVSAPLDMAVPTASGTGGSWSAVPLRFWWFAGVALLYGVCETTNGNWAQLDMTSDVGASAKAAAAALTAFWAMVTVGRVVFATLERVLPPRWTYRILPFALAVVFVLIAVVPVGGVALGVVAFGLAGLACSAMLPLTISLGQDAFPAIGATGSGAVIAAYQLGYGIAAFGIGPLHTAGVALSTVYGAAAVVAVAMGLGSIVVTQRASP